MFIVCAILTCGSHMPEVTRASSISIPDPAPAHTQALPGTQAPEARERSHTQYPQLALSHTGLAQELREGGSLSQQDIEDQQVVLQRSAPISIGDHSVHSPEAQFVPLNHTRYGQSPGPEAAPSDRLRPLVWAAAYGDTEWVKKFIGECTSAEQLNSANVAGFTALMYAAASGHTECVKALTRALKVVEHINWTNAEGHTALTYAAKYGRTECVHALLDVLKDSEHINLLDADGLTPLVWAAGNGHSACVNALVGALGISEQVNFANADGITALMIAAEQGHTECVMALLGVLETTGQINLANAEGFTALTLAARNGHTECVKALVGALKSAEQINRGNADGFTALMIAAEHGHTECVTALLGVLKTVEHINRADVYGFTALMSAAAQGHAGPVRALIGQLQYQVGSINAFAPDGTTALSVALTRREFETVRLLLDALQRNGRAPASTPMVDLTTIVIAGHFGHFGVLCTWLACTGNLELIAPFFSGHRRHASHRAETVLLCAADLGNAPVVAMLLQHGTQADWRRADGKGVLALAAAKGHWPVLEAWKAAGHDLPRRFIMEAMRASGLYLETAAEPLSIESRDAGQANLLMRAISNKWPHLAEALVQMKTQDLLEKMSLA